MELKSTKLNNFFKPHLTFIFKMKLRKIFEILFLIIILAIIAYKVDLKESWVILQTNI